MPANNSGNTRHGGVGLFYRNTLPIIVSNDLSFDESIFVELKFGRKKIFFTVLYRSPALNHTSPQFRTFLSYYKNLHFNIMAEYPFATFLPVTLMHTPNFGGPMEKLLFKVWKLKIYLLH